MADIFDHEVHCSKCGKKMKKIVAERSGFKIRTLECPGCGSRVYHPSDMEEFNKYSQLKNQNFQVKLRRVGNSYTVSIPRELINFLEAESEDQHQHERHDPFERMHRKMNDEMEIMNKMVTLALEQANRLSLSFGPEGNVNVNGNNNGNYDRTREFNRNGVHGVVREKSETKQINGGKGFVSRKIKVFRMSKKPEQKNVQEDDEPMLKEDDS